MAELKDSGLVVDRLPDVLNRLQTLALQNFSDLIPIGQDLSLDESSVLGRILSTVADPIRMQEEAIQGIYAAKDIQQATGQQLDDLCFLSGVMRQGATKAEAMLICSGDVGTTIPAGSFVANKITGDSFLTQTSVTLTNVNCNAIEATITISPSHVYTLDWVVDSSVVTNTTISISNPSTNPSVIAQTLVNAITAATDKLEAHLNVDGSIYVGITNKNDTGRFTLSSATVVRVHKPVDSICQVNGKRPQNANHINTIQSSVFGWNSAYNPFDAEEGRDKMNDSELRLHHFQTKFASSTSQLSAMYSEIKKIVGVRYVNIAQNVFDSPVNGIISHSFAPVVLGGNQDKIGQAILNTAPLGIASYGDVAVTAYDINSNPVVVKFSRPDLVSIKISIVLETYPEFQESSPNLIRQAIIDYISTLTVGDSILYSRLFTPINTVKGFSVVSMKIGRVGGVLSSENIQLTHKEIATISASDITFGS